MPHTLAVLVVVFIAGLLWLKLSPRAGNRASGPPGPAGDPIIGHVRFVPANRPEITYRKWGQQYNTDILFLNFLGQRVVILNSLEASIDLLDKRSGNYIGRPRIHSLEEQGWPERYSMGLIDSRVQIRKHRKMMQRALTVNNCLVYRDAQQHEARKLVLRIIEHPKSWRLHLQTLSTTLILRVAYGIEVQGKNDPYVVIADKTSEALGGGGAPGTTLIDVFPLIRSLPSWFKLIPELNFARRCLPWVTKLHEVPFAYVQHEMKAGTAKTSIIRNLLGERGDTKPISSLPVDTDVITDDDLKGARGSLYVAGQDTTWSTLSVFILGMVLNPNAQAKARKELDSVLGKDRLPTFADSESLTYVEYIVQETFRWGPVVPLIIPHKSTEDDTYRGYFIPKSIAHHPSCIASLTNRADTLVIANAYAINRDETVYTNPDTFDPDRYVPKAEGGREEPYSTSHFGFGRRICPGQHLGSASVWIAIATMLATLSFSKSKDSDGNEITPDPGWTTGLTAHPEPFECEIKPRSEDVVALVEEGLV